MSDNSTYDVYKDSPLRLLGYANEVAEAFRPVVHKYAVYSGYILATGYMFADVADKTYKMHKEGGSLNKCMVTAVDVCVWQSLASLIVPSIAINRFSASSRYIMAKTTRLDNKRIKLASVVLSIAFIPFIIKPIDKSVDFVMDNYVRDRLGTTRKA